MVKVADRIGRKFKKLRISLLDACNFSCNYCMPEKRIFSNAKENLSREEIHHIVKNLLRFGLEEIRFTGGEPTLRKDLLPIVAQVSNLPLKRIGLTTNALRLGPLLGQLRETKLTNINVSLDSLNPQVFHRITKSNSLEKVLNNLLLAKEMGFQVKVNCVLMKGINHLEVPDFVRFSSLEGIEVRFLEVMNIGVVRANFSKWFIKADEVIASLKNEYELKRLPTALDSTSFKFSLSNGAKIGFIASESKPFCGNCSRLRLSAKGEIRSCLFKEKGISLKDKKPEEYHGVLLESMRRKPISRIPFVNEPMHLIGG